MTLYKFIDYSTWDPLCLFIRINFWHDSQLYPQEIGIIERKSDKNNESISTRLSNTLSSSEVIDYKKLTDFATTKNKNEAIN